jgi:hypothetical protein
VRMDVRYSTRKRWLQKLVCSEPERLAFLAHLTMEGSPLAWFGVTAKDLAPGFAVPTQRLASYTGTGLRSVPTSDEHIWLEALGLQ